MSVVLIVAAEACRTAGPLVEGPAGRAAGAGAGAQQEQPGIEPFTQQDREGFEFTVAGWAEQAEARSDIDTIPTIASTATQQERRWRRVVNMVAPNPE
jgi:hypothetical protein